MHITIWQTAEGEFLIFLLYAMLPQCTYWLSDMFTKWCLSYIKYCFFFYYTFTLNWKHNSINMSVINIHTFIIVAKSRQSYANSCAKLSFKCQAWCVVCCHCGRGLTGAQTSLSPHRLLTFERYENDFACTILGVQLSPWTNLLCVFLLIKT